MSDPRHSHLGRHDVWGDDPEEQDASRIIAEVEAEEEIVARRWHDYPVLVQIKAVLRFLGRNAKRIGVTIAGVLVLLVGLAGLVLPILPGWLLIFAGLGILATEYVWARRLLVKAKDVAMAAKDKAVAKKEARTAKKEARRSSARS